MPLIAFDGLFGCVQVAADARGVASRISRELGEASKRLVSDFERFRVLLSVPQALLIAS